MSKATNVIRPDADESHVLDRQLRRTSFTCPRLLIDRYMPRGPRKMWPNLRFSVALPVVLTVVTIPFSYSIANGIGVGFIAWAVFRSAAGKAREISPLLWIVAAGFLVYFARGWIESLVGI